VCTSVRVFAVRVDVCLQCVWVCVCDVSNKIVDMLACCFGGHCTTFSKLLMEACKAQILELLWICAIPAQPR